MDGKHPAKLLFFFIFFFVLLLGGASLSVFVLVSAFVVPVPPGLGSSSCLRFRGRLTVTTPESAFWPGLIAGGPLCIRAWSCWRIGPLLLLSRLRLRFLPGPECWLLAVADLLVPRRRLPLACHRYRSGLWRATFTLSGVLVLCLLLPGLALFRLTPLNCLRCFAGTFALSRH